MKIAEKKVTEVKAEVTPEIKYFVLDLDQSLISKSNYRRGISGKQWRKYADFEKDLALEVSMNLPKDWSLGEIGDPIELRPKVISVIFAVSLVDTSNFSKSILDACEKIVYHNDASVVYSSAIGERKRLNQKIVIGFAQLPPGSSIENAVQHARILEEQVLKISRK